MKNLKNVRRYGDEHQYIGAMWLICMAIIVFAYTCTSVCMYMHPIQIP